MTPRAPLGYFESWPALAAAMDDVILYGNGYLHLKRATDGTLEVERIDPATITLDRTAILALHGPRSVADQSCRECGAERPCPTARLAGAPDPDDDEATTP